MQLVSLARCALNAIKQVDRRAATTAGTVWRGSINLAERNPGNALVVCTVDWT